METEKADRRVRRTKKTLLQALTKLMNVKKVNNITIKELTDLADVNRSTFYLYYKDIFDMVEKVETELLNEFSEAYDKFSKEVENYDDLLSFLNYLFKFVQSNAEMCKILLGHDGNYTFIEKLKVIIKQYDIPLDDTTSELEANYVVPFVISGCIGVIQQWLEDDMKVPPKDMADVLVKMLC